MLQVLYIIFEFSVLPQQQEFSASLSASSGSLSMTIAPITRHHHGGGKPLDRLSQLERMGRRRFTSRSRVSQLHNSSIESEKGVITIQRCSVENQKGTIAAQSPDSDSALLVLNGTLFNNHNAFLALNRRFVLLLNTVYIYHN